MSIDGLLVNWLFEVLQWFCFWNYRTGWVVVRNCSEDITCNCNWNCSKETWYCKMDCSEVRTPGIAVRTHGIAGGIAVRWGEVLLVNWLQELLHWGEDTWYCSEDTTWCHFHRSQGGAVLLKTIYNSVHVQRVLLSWITLCEWSWLTLVTGVANIDGFASNVKKWIYIINCVELWGREGVQLFVWTVSVQILGVFGLSGLCMTLYHLFRSDSACQDMCSHMSNHVLFSYPCQTQLILLFAQFSFFVISIVHSSEE